MIFNDNLNEIHFKINFSYLFILHRSGLQKILSNKYELY